MLPQVQCPLHGVSKHSWFTLSILVVQYYQARNEMSSGKCRRLDGGDMRRGRRFRPSRPERTRNAPLAAPEERGQKPASIHARRHVHHLAGSRIWISPFQTGSYGSSISSKTPYRAEGISLNPAFQRRSHGKGRVLKDSPGILPETCQAKHVWFSCRF